MSKRILIIGFVWPEPTSSAAGWRMLQLIKQLKAYTSDIHFACAALKSEASFPLEDLGIIEHAIILNDDSFNTFISSLKPDIVVYDRFMIEEQFGWRVKQELPDCLTILDTEDLHYVRKARTVAFKNNTDVNFDTTDCYRELTSIFRTDLSIIISQWEYDLLVNNFNVPTKQLLYVPFIEQSIVEETIGNIPDFTKREHLMFIGNFIHDPNYQTVLQLKKMWPFIKKRLPNVQLHIYGAYASQKVLQLNNHNDGFIIKGKAVDVNETMQKYKLLVAPIPYGAGLKGKFIDGFKNGLPNVTTPIGGESMFVNFWGGSISNEEDFAAEIENLYVNENSWNQAVKNGFKIINEQFSERLWNDVLISKVVDIVTDLQKHRSNLIFQKILWQNSLQAVKYMSLWIQEKNK